MSVGKVKLAILYNRTVICSSKDMYLYSHSTISSRWLEQPAIVHFRKLANRSIFFFCFWYRYTTEYQKAMFKLQKSRKGRNTEHLKGPRSGISMQQGDTTTNSDAQFASSMRMFVFFFKPRQLEETWSCPQPRSLIQHRCCRSSKGRSTPTFQN